MTADRKSMSEAESLSKELEMVSHSLGYALLALGQHDRKNTSDFITALEGINQSVKELKEQYIKLSSDPSKSHQLSLIQQGYQQELTKIKEDLKTKIDGLSSKKVGSPLFKHPLSQTDPKLTQILTSLMSAITPPEKTRKLQTDKK